MDQKCHIRDKAHVVLHYTLSLANGERQVASTRESGPELVIIGRGQLLPALENRLLGLVAGDVRRFEIAAIEANAEETPELQVLPRDEFPPGMDLKPGTVVGFTLPSGEEIAGTVRETAAHDVIVDFSHPLTGHDLVWEVEILSVTAPDVVPSSPSPGSRR